MPHSISRHSQNDKNSPLPSVPAFPPHSSNALTLLQRKIESNAMTPLPNDSSKKLQSLAIPLLLSGIGILGIVFGIIRFLDRTGRIDSQALENHLPRQQRTDYRHIPPHLITYQSTTLFRFYLDSGQPTCFAVQNDSTFIIGTAEPPTLLFLDENGMRRRKIELPEEPRAIAVGTSETIFSDKTVVAHHQHIAVYNAEGAQVSSLKLNDEQSDIRSLVLTPKYLFAADTGTRSIYRFDADGTFHEQFGFNFVVYASPITMTYSSQTDLLYIANPGKHRVEVFTQDGTYRPELSWGEASASLTGFAGCCNPIGLAVLDDGRILTIEKGVSRIKIFKQDGSLDSIVAGPNTLDIILTASGLLHPLKPEQRHFAAAVLSDGRIAVFDFENKMVRLFAPIDGAKRQ